MTFSMANQELKNEWKKELAEDLTTLSFHSWIIKRYNDANNILVINLISLGKKLKNRIPYSDKTKSEIILEIIEEEFKIISKLHKIYPDL
jgi:hypothetical protein